MKYLVLIETSGNQRYIFSTNKLRENVGASELTYQIGTTVVRNLIENRTDVEEIITTSGKALLLADDKDIAKELVREITEKALIDMPGLTVHGAICKVEDENSAESLHKAVGDVHKRLDEIRYRIPSNLQRFQRLPFAAQCASSNLPASYKIFHKKENETERLSALSYAKRENRDSGFERIKEKLKGFDLIEPEDIEKQEWLAVIHADGNGVGETFLNFYEKANLQDKNKDEYVEKFRNFSNALDDCTIAATRIALEKFKKSFLENQEKKAIRRGTPLTKDEIKIPIVPLILGGDDLTMICDGKYAIKFTKDFLIEFEKQAQNHLNINQITKLGICAGIAIIKPKFPFHQAYELAEELLQSAKKTKAISPSLSAFDYHVLYDSSGIKLDDIREKTPFVARPYVVSENADEIVEKEPKLSEEKQEAKIWVRNHHFEELKQRVEVMKPDENGDRKLPNSQLHVLREGLFVADKTKDIQKEVDARAKLIAHRYDDENDKPFEKLYVVKEKDKETLFFNEEDQKLTHFLDALDIVEFWK